MRRSAFLFMVLAVVWLAAGGTQKDSAAGEGKTLPPFAQALNKAPDYLYYDGRCNCFRELGRPFGEPAVRRDSELETGSGGAKSN